MRAVFYIARHVGDGPLSARDIAAGAGIPHGYLQKLLTELVRSGVLTSSRGIGGGFRLGRDPQRLRLADVVAPFTKAQRPMKCPCGHAVCERWGRVLASLQEFLHTTTVADLTAECQA